MSVCTIFTRTSLVLPNKKNFLHGSILFMSMLISSSLFLLFTLFYFLFLIFFQCLAMSMKPPPDRSFKFAEGIDCENFYSRGRAGGPFRTNLLRVRFHQPFLISWFLDFFSGRIGGGGGIDVGCCGEHKGNL